MSYDEKRQLSLDINRVCYFKYRICSTKLILSFPPTNWAMLSQLSSSVNRRIRTQTQTRLKLVIPHPPTQPPPPHPLQNTRIRPF